LSLLITLKNGNVIDAHCSVAEAHAKITGAARSDPRMVLLPGTDGGPDVAVDRHEVLTIVEDRD
jgi:hypothetical protein